MSTIQINHPQLSVQVAPGADTGRARLTFSVDISKSSLNNLIRLLDAALPPGQELVIDLGKFSHSKKPFRPPRPENMEQVLREKSQYPNSPRPASNFDQPKSILKTGSPTTTETSDKSKKKKVSFNLPTDKPKPSSKMPAAFQGLKSELKGLPQELIIPAPILKLMDKETLGYAREWEPGLPFLVPKDVEVDEKTAKEAVEFMKKRAESRTGQAATAPPVIDSRYGDSLDHSRAINRSRRRSMSAPQTQRPQHRTNESPGPDLKKGRPTRSDNMPAAFQGLKPELKGLPRELIIPDPILNLMDKETLGYAREWEPGLPFLVPKDVEVNEKTAKEAVEFMKKRAESRIGRPDGIQQAPSTPKGTSEQSQGPDRTNEKPTNKGPLKTVQNFFKSIVNVFLPTSAHK